MPWPRAGAFAVAAAVALGLLVSLVPLSARATGTAGSALVAPETLMTGNSLLSPSGAYRAVMQTDGNFVIYGPSGAVFSTRTTGAGASLAMQSDGNLVLYVAGRAVFSTGTSGTSATARLQDDGNFVVYGSGRALWSSKGGRVPPPPPPVTTVGSSLAAGGSLQINQQLVSPGGAYRAIVQADGNFVIYGRSGAVYSTSTRGTGARLVMQGDGNLVLYAGGRAAFFTGTTGTSPSARLQDDGNFVVYGSGRALWSSKSGRIPPPPPPVTTIGSALGANGVLSVNQQLVSPNGRYRAIVQSDGNFVVYGPSGVAFTTATHGSAARLVMQSDGKLVLYASGRAAFISGSYGSSPSAQLQDDGNFVVYAAGRAQWSSKSGRIPAPSFGAGTKRVGVDIPAGTYRMRADAPNLCYWARLSSLSTDDIIANNLTLYHDVVTISPSDAAFTSQDCGTWTQDLSPLKSPSAPTGNGTWIVGTDMAPGIWAAPGGSDCYWERRYDFSGNGIIDNAFGDIGPQVQINPTDAGFVSDDCGTWQRVG